MRLPVFVWFLALLITGVTVAADPLHDRAKQLFEPIPTPPPAMPGEAATPEKLALGKMLYFDPRLSESHDLSCSSCHNISMGGGDGRSSTPGQLGGRKVATVLNAVFNKSQFWDGRAATLKEQVLKSVMANPRALLNTRGGPSMITLAEMEISRQHAVDELKSIPGYVEAFKQAFPEEADAITYDNIGKAIALFEATLITPDSPFDRWLEGDETALNVKQKQGFAIFVDKGCSNCHNGVNIGGNQFARFGLVQSPGPEFRPPDDRGRFEVTKNIDDNYVFKVPTLRNIELTAPYFHSRRGTDLKQAVAVMARSQLGQELTNDEIDSVVEFLKSLTGRQPEVVLPILPPSVTSQSRPQP
ncbi:MAG: c-type cytochrome [Alphaproteobacteria bacterium]|nr:c-type cytochrome [Alphaproteobacteria bacterium]